MTSVSCALLGCDIVQGFENAGDALFPRVKTYLDAPGYHVLAGSYRDVALLSGEEAYLAARSPDAPDVLTLTRYTNPAPCRLPGVGSYQAYGPPELATLVIAYFHDPSDGVLHFADGKCRELEFSIEDARLPVAAGYDGRLLVQSGTRLLAVNPLANEQTELADDVTEVLERYSFDGIVFIAGGELRIVTRDDSRKVMSFGWQVERAVGFFDTLFFEDSRGVHELSATPLGDTVLVAERAVVPGACNLALLPAPEPPGSFQNTDLIAYNAPCFEGPSWSVDSPRGPLVVRNPRSTDSLVIDQRRVDARFTKVVWLDQRASPSLTGPVGLFYLSDVDADGAGELRFYTEGQAEDPVLGRTSSLRYALVAERTLEGERGFDHGFALLELTENRGELIRWEPDGTTQSLAGGVVNAELYAPWPAVLTDFDGSQGVLAQLAGGELHPLASGVPLYGGAAPDYHEYRSGKALVMSDFDGARGTLSLAVPSGGPEALDDFGFPLRRIELIARNVGRYRRSFLGDLPGFIYIRDFDPGTRTGRLEYRNTELGFTSLVAQGVADLNDTGLNVFYSVPFGERAGIWVTRKK